MAVVGFRELYTTLFKRTCLGDRQEFLRFPCLDCLDLGLYPLSIALGGCRLKLEIEG